MKFTINRNLFLENLNNVMRAISSRTTIPILSGIKMALSETELVLTGSDTDISIEIKIPVDEDLTVASSGSIVLPARFFSEIIKKLPGRSFSFEVMESFQTKITSENSEFTINGLDANNYPRLPEISSESSFTISGKTFKKIITETNFAVATQESRPILTGVHFLFTPQATKAVATDSHRLAQRSVKVDGPKTKADLIIPGNSLTELSRIIGDADPKVAVNPGDNQVLFVIGNVSFYSRLLEGTYPDTDRLLPTQETTSAEFEISSLEQAIGRVSLLTHEGRNNVVKMTLSIADQSVTLQGNSPEIGNVEEKLAVKTLTGKDLEISFNPDYLQAALRASETETVEMKFTQPLRPFTVLPGKAEVDFTQLITPVRTF